MRGLSGKPSSNHLPGNHTYWLHAIIKSKRLIAAGNANAQFGVYSLSVEVSLMSCPSADMGATCQRLLSMQYRECASPGFTCKRMNNHFWQCQTSGSLAVAPTPPNPQLSALLRKCSHMHDA